MPLYFTSSSLNSSSFHLFYSPFSLVLSSNYALSRLLFQFLSPSLRISFSYPLLWSKLPSSPLSGYPRRAMLHELRLRRLGYTLMTSKRKVIVGRCNSFLIFLLSFFLYMPASRLHIAVQRYDVTFLQRYSDSKSNDFFSLFLFFSLSKFSTFLYFSFISLSFILYSLLHLHGLTG